MTNSKCRKLMLVPNMFKDASNHLTYWNLINMTVANICSYSLIYFAVHLTLEFS